MSEQPDIQTQESGNNLPAVIGDMLQNLRAVIADQMPDEDAYLLATEMVTVVETKFVQVMEDGRMIVEAALNQRDEAISLQQIAEERAEEIMAALDDWSGTDNEIVRDVVESIEESIQEYLYEGWTDMVADDEFVEKLADSIGLLTDAPAPDRYDTAFLFLRLTEYHTIPNPMRITKQNVDVMEAVYLKLKELAAKADQTFYGVRPDEDDEIEAGDVEEDEE